MREAYSNVAPNLDSCPSRERYNATEQYRKRTKLKGQDREVGRVRGGDARLVADAEERIVDALHGRRRAESARPAAADGTVADAGERQKQAGNGSGSSLSSARRAFCLLLIKEMAS